MTGDRKIDARMSRRRTARLTGPLTTAVVAACYVTLFRIDIGCTLSEVIFVVLPVLAGVLIGRLWAIGLPLLMLVSLAIFGDGCAAAAASNPSIECDINWWALLVVMYVPIAMFLVAFGVGARALCRYVWRDYVLVSPAR